jgi:hypothetical protein
VLLTVDAGWLLLSFSFGCVWFKLSIQTRTKMGTREILFEGARTHLSAFQDFLAERGESTPGASPDSFYQYSLKVDLKASKFEGDLGPRLKNKFLVCATRRRAGAKLGEIVGSDNEGKASRYTANIIGVLPMIRAMVACPMWTHGKFVFEHGNPIEPSFVPFLDSFMFEMFSLLRSHRSLSSLEIQFNRLSHVHVRPLLSADLSIETLILTPGAMEVPYHAESIAEYFSRNSVLKSCTLELESCDFKCHPEFLGIILSPFTTSVPSKANVVLKELVVRMGKAPLGLWEESVTKLVRCNTSLQKLELLFSQDCSEYTLASKVWFNRELEEFGFLCSSNELSVLKDRVGIFDQAKPAFTSLKLCPASPLYGEDFMQSLRCLLVSDSLSLKHLNVSSVAMGQPWTTWNNCCDDARDVELGTQEMLTSMVSSELRLNTTLQSLVVGNWKLLRVGTEWQTSYGGPCLRLRKVAEGENPQHSLRFSWTILLLCRDVEEECLPWTLFVLQNIASK